MMQKYFKYRTTKYNTMDRYFAAFILFVIIPLSLFISSAMLNYHGITLLDPIIMPAGIICSVSCLIMVMIDSDQK